MEKPASALPTLVLWAVLVVCLSLTASPSIAQEHPVDYRQAQASDSMRGVISGTVFDTTGRPARGACIQLLPRGMFWSGVIRVRCTDTGHSRLTVRLGTYDVFFSAPQVHFEAGPKRVVLNKESPVQNVTLSLVPPTRKCGDAGCGTLEVLPFTFPNPY